jgi:pSer/pThr/pTyr-binding forkhead associated (FHA) protein
MSGPAPKKAGNRRRSVRAPRRLRVQEGAAIYDKGDASDAIFRVVSGKVHLSSPGRRKGEGPVELGPQEIFGHAGLLTGSPRRSSASAAAKTVLDVIDREVALELLDRQDEATRNLLADLFGSQSSEMDGADDGVNGIQLVRLLLKPASRPLAAWIGREPIEITRLPFVIGRTSEGEDGSAEDLIDLVLTDERPYQLSRQHFVIDTHEGELVIRDSGSYHGTTVNSQHIGGERGTSIAALRLGENKIVAGSSDSPYCFTLLIEAS